MSSNSANRLSLALNLTDVSSEEELAPSLLILLTSATDSSNVPVVTLSKIAHEIIRAGAASLLDPLDTLPILLPCKDPAAKEILSLMAECSSAKEMVMAVQVAVERLTSALEEDDDDDNEAEENERDSQILSLPVQLAILIDLYAACLPRLKLRRQSAPETMRPLLAELESIVELVGRVSSTGEGRTLISSTAYLVKNLATWSTSVNKNLDKADACDVILKSLLDCTLMACHHCIKSNLAQRVFETFYPRLAVRSSVQPGWEEGENALSDAKAAYLSINVLSPLFTSTPSIPELIIFAHSGSHEISPSQLQKLVPILVASIQSGRALDETLSILIWALDPLKTHPRPYLQEEVIHPLFSVLPPLSSSHPDPLVRHQCFRILSLLLSSCSPPIRMHLLHELVMDDDFPQMRVAAVGLVKEAVLEGLAYPPSVFASPSFFDVFGPILFRLHPPDLFDKPKLSLDDIQQSSEFPRLIECLGTYYTILLRDKTNLTHMRDSNALSQVENTFLVPIRSALESWLKQLAGPEGHMHDNELLLGSLQMSLERVDGAISGLGGVQWN